MRKHGISVFKFLHCLSNDLVNNHPWTLARCLTTNSVLKNNNDEGQTIIRPKTSEKAKVIQIWPGMRDVDVANAIGASLEDVHTTIRKIKVSPYLQDIYDVKKLLEHLEYRFTIVPSPSNNTQVERPSIDELIQSKKIPDGKLFKFRPPVITIMGHVDHGKTTLLDALRQSQIVKQEFGGITQHIGAFIVSLDKNKTRKSLSNFSGSTLSKVITFLDTPGHAAFKNMRQRGANVTDIVLLIIAADDGVLDQTIESIKYAQNAQVPIIVVVNKIDRVKSLKESLKRIKDALYTHGILTEDEGGDTIMVKISALKQEGLEHVTDAIISLSEVLQIKAPYDGGVRGSVIEVKLDPHMGKMATILIEKGQLTKGAFLLASDMSYCRVRSMVDEYGKKVDQVTPGLPVLVSGWKDNGLPAAGDAVYQFAEEKSIKEIVQYAKQLRDEERAYFIAQANAAKTEEQKKIFMDRVNSTDENIPTWLKKYRLRKEHVKTFVDDPMEPFKVRVLIRSDVQGSAEVLQNIVDSYPNDSQLVKLLSLSQSVGPVTEADVISASQFSNAIIYAFNVPLTPAIFAIAKAKGVNLRHFNVIYHLVDDLRKEISLRLPEVEHDDEVGKATVIKEYKVNSKKNRTIIAGCRCTKGPIFRENVLYKLIRDDKVIATALEVADMKFEKTDVKEIPNGSDCGLTFKNLPHDLNFKTQDVLICYKIRKTQPETTWRPPGF